MIIDLNSPSTAISEDLYYRLVFSSKAFQKLSDKISNKEPTDSPKKKGEE